MTQARMWEKNEIPLQVHPAKQGRKQTQEEKATPYEKKNTRRKGGEHRGGLHRAGL